MGNGVGSGVGNNVGLVDGGMLKRAISSLGTSDESELPAWIKKVVGSIFDNLASSVGIRALNLFDSMMKSAVIAMSRPS